MAGSLLPGISVPSLDAWPAPVATWQYGGQSGQLLVHIDLIRGVGRSGAVPDIALNYQGGSHGVFGLGWSVNVPAIVRGNGRHLPRYRDTGPDADPFSSSEVGELVQVLTERGGQWRAESHRLGGANVTRFRPRVDAAFSRIERRADRATGEIHWVTISRDNVTRVYGRTADARIADPSDPRRVAQWLLEEELDSAGNRILFQYKRENLVGVSESVLPERHRLASGLPEAMRHLKSVKWGNRRPGEAGDWLFELVFDYGEHDAERPMPDGPGPWALRPDAVSNYRAGFELRTRRLCRRVLLFHHLSELGGTATLTRAHELSYDQTPEVSLLTGVTLRTYRRDPAGRVSSDSLPATTFGYSPALSSGPVRDVENARMGGGASQWHDFDGTALPGLVSHEPGGALVYRKNLGRGRLDNPAAVPSVPSLTDTAAPLAQSLDKPFGDGRSCLIDFSEGPGYQERQRAGGWLSYTTFSNAPTVRATTAGSRQLDLDGDGLADLMLAGEHGARWYRFNGREGWAAACETETAASARNALRDRTGTVLLADMTGDGLADLVQVRPGSVCYWPNLGYGRFGEPVHMANSPQLDQPDLFDPARVRFADIDGSGRSDLIYVGREAILSCANQCSNSFGAPQRVANLPVVTDLDSVAVVDLLGTGTGCLVWSSVLPGTAMRPMQYVELSGGQRAHAMTSIRNGQGLELDVSYASSTELMLDDLAAGRRWFSTLPFPVWLITELRERDETTGVQRRTSWSYRHGYYDETERESRGFAYVERREQHELPSDPARSTFGGQPPARVVRTWYHTGAYSDRIDLDSRLAADFFNGDPARPTRPGLSFENDAGVAPRELLRALQGRPIREEVYADETDAPPYLVTDYGYLVRGLQPGSPAAPASTAAFVQEVVERTYERVLDDPRVAHRLTLEIDVLGSVTRRATIAYARRRLGEAEQERPLVTLEEHEVCNRDGELEWYRAGVPVADRVFEVGPLPPLSGVELLGVDDFRRWLSDPGLVDPPFEQDLPPTGPLRRRLVASCERFYWDDALTAPARLGAVNRLALPCEGRRAAFTPGLLDAVYRADVPNRASLGMAGYEFDRGLWWARSARTSYDPAAFYQASASRTPFGAEHTIRYDAHHLFVAEVRDPVGNVHRAEYDYQALAAATVVDANGATGLTSFDVWGLPAAAALSGASGEGDSLAAPTIEVVRDPHAWERRRTPASVRIFQRARHGDRTSPLEQRVAYLDGQGRALQSKRLAESGPGEATSRWVVESHVVATATGVPVRSYGPGFTADDGFTPESGLIAVPVTRTALDALGRARETRQPDGAVSRTVTSAWRLEEWDANDASAGSDWLLARRRAGATSRERAEADAAERHAGTPAVKHLDPAGRPFLIVEDGGVAGQAATRTALTIGGELATVIDARGIRTERRAYDMLARPVRVRSTASGEQRVFYDASGEPAYAWSAHGAEQRLVRDALRRLVRRDVRARGGDWRVAERLVWGEHADGRGGYHRGRLYLHYDGAGQLKVLAYDFRGHAIRTERRYRRDLTVAADWSRLSSADEAIEVERSADADLSADPPFVTVAAHDAQGRMTARTSPEGSTTSVDYGPRGLPSRIRVTFDGRATDVMHDPVYDAAGRRRTASLGNGMRESFGYDAASGFLTSCTTIGPAGHVLRDLAFSHDAVGNVLHISDGAQQTRYFRNAVVSPDQRFRYDALYRLVEAEGREAATPAPPPNRRRVPPLNPIPHDNDLTAVQRYTESYTYDLAGNLTEIDHAAPAAGGWVVRHAIDSASDRIRRITRRDGSPLTSVFAYDAAGSATSLEGLTGLVWDEDDRLTQAALTGGGTAFYVYDATGQRAAHVVVRLGGEREERLYLDGCERYRRTSAAGGVIETVESTHVDDNERRLLLLERRRAADESGALTLWRYQHVNQVGSCCLETGQDGDVLTFEEFRPYGAPSYHAARGVVLPKRYRFASREHDRDTGLVLFGVRYYAPWLCRWISADPGGMLDGTNRYWYARNNPVTLSDPTGFQAQLNYTPARQQNFTPATQFVIECFNGRCGVTSPAANASFSLLPIPDAAPRREPEGYWTERGFVGAVRILPEPRDPLPARQVRGRPGRAPQPTSTTARGGAASPASPPAPAAAAPTEPAPPSSAPPAAPSEAERPDVELLPGPPAQQPSPPEQRDPFSQFVARGGNHVVAGATGMIIGVVLLSMLGPVGWAAAFAMLGAMAGAFQFGYGAAELLTSPNRSATQEAEVNRRGQFGVNMLSPVGYANAVVVGALTGGDPEAVERAAEGGATVEQWATRVGLARAGIRFVAQSLPRVAQSLPRMLPGGVRFRLAEAEFDTRWANGTTNFQRNQAPSSGLPQNWPAPGEPAPIPPRLETPTPTSPGPTSPASPASPAPNASDWASAETPADLADARCGYGAPTLPDQPVRGGGPTANPASAQNWRCYIVGEEYPPPPAVDARIHGDSWNVPLYDSTGAVLRLIRNWGRPQVTKTPAHVQTVASVIRQAIESTQPRLTAADLSWSVVFGPRVSAARPDALILHMNNEVDVIEVLSESQMKTPATIVHAVGYFWSRTGDALRALRPMGLRPGGFIVLPPDPDIILTWPLPRFSPSISATKLFGR